MSLAKTGKYLIIFLPILGYHIFKGLGFPAIIFPDETFYSYGIRLQPYAQAEHPNYLYFALYSWLPFFGENFLDASRTANAIIYTLSGIFIYKTARLGCSENVSIAVAAISLLLPTSSVTIFLMPDAVYHTGFWIIAWYMLSADRESAARRCAVSGTGLALLALIKPHAVFLLPAAAAHTALTADDPKGTAAAAIRTFGITAAVFLAVKFAGGYILAGWHGVTIFGAVYNRLASSGAEELSPGLFLEYWLTNFAGHLMVMCLLFSLPILIITAHLRVSDSGSESRLHSLSIFAAISLLTLTGASSLFSALEASAKPELTFQYAAAVQTRYYHFLYPLFFIACGYAFCTKSEKTRFYPRSMVYSGIAVVFFISYALYDFLRTYFLVPFPHHPEIYFLFRYRLTIAGTFFSAAFLTCAAVWFLRRSRRAAGVYLFLLIPLYQILTLTKMQHYLEQNHSAKPPFRLVAENAGDKLRGDTGKLIVISSSEKMVHTIRFFVDRNDAEYLHAKKGMLSRDAIPQDAVWAILFGEISLPEELIKHRIPLGIVPGGVAALLRLGDFGYTAVMGQPKWPVLETREMPGETAVVYDAALPEDAWYTIVVPEGNTDATLFDLEIAGIPGHALVTPGQAVRMRGDNPGRTVWIWNAEGYPWVRPVRLEVVPAEEDPLPGPPDTGEPAEGPEG